jgi:hypothetical protein
MKYLGGSQFAIGPLFYPFSEDENGTPDWARQLEDGAPFPNQSFVVCKCSSSRADDMLVKHIESGSISDAEQAAYFSTDRMFRITSALISSQPFQDFVASAEHIGRKTGKLARDVVKSGEHSDLIERFKSGLDADTQLNRLTKQLECSLETYKRNWLAVVESTPNSEVNSDGAQFFDVWQQLEIHSQILADYPLPVAPGVVIKDKIRETQTALNQAIQTWIERSNEALGEMRDVSQSDHSHVTKTRRL